MYLKRGWDILRKMQLPYHSLSDLLTTQTQREECILFCRVHPGLGKFESIFW